MAVKFVIKKNATGKFHFNLLAGNGEVIAISKTYNSKEAAKNGIESVKASAPTATVEDRAFWAATFG